MGDGEVVIFPTDVSLVDSMPIVVNVTFVSVSSIVVEISAVVALLDSVVI